MKQQLILKNLFVVLVLSLITVCTTFSQFDFSDDKDVDVGVIEKLDEFIPNGISFANEAGDTVLLSELINKPTILVFVYFNCPGMCDPILHSVSEVIGNLDMTLGEEYQVITISFNHRDDHIKAVEKKNNFVQNIDPDKRTRWKWLTGDQENIKKVTDAAGYKFKSAGLDFVHPACIMVLSPESKITRYLYGLTYLPFDVKMAIIEAQKGIARPTINKLLTYCFAYDPTSKTYTLQITRITGTIILLIAVIVFIVLLLKGRRKKNKKK